jgi:broad specificity phosphatase PhoE
MRPSDAGRMKAEGLFFIRHAAPEIDPARPPTSWRLSAEGRRAAAALAGRVRADAVVASPEPKALETASALGAPVEIDARLREHDRVGVGWLDDFVGAVEAGFARPHDVVFGVESYAAALARFAAAVNDARAAHPDGRLAIVSHGTVIALYVGRESGRDPLAVWRELRMPDVLELPTR